MNIWDRIIIGGGAAGLICGGFAANQGEKVLILEKMPRPARKILVTGKGRCNITNNCDQAAFIKMVKTNPRFLYSSYSGFTAQDTMNLFESLGVPVETQRGSRVFPKSQKAMDVADALVKFAKSAGVHIYSEEVKSLVVKEGKVAGVRTVNKDFFAEKVVIATGGKSYPGTGSTGDGYQLAQSVGHSIIPLRPSLIPIITEERWVADTMGLSLKNVELRLLKKEKAKVTYKELGEMIFTHFGVSGPLVLSASAHMSGEVTDYSLEIDLKPGLSYEQLDARIVRDFEENVNRNFENSLSALLPKSLVPIIVKLSGIPRFNKVNQITKEQRGGLVEVIKGVKLTPVGFRPLEEAVVTAGGVNVKEIDPKTMESKLLPGLYFAGEVMDVDAFTGGFNLQIAFSTGHAAGTAN